MNDELEKITWWFKSNSLCLNVNKTNYMFFAVNNKKKSWAKNLKLVYKIGTLNVFIKQNFYVLS